MLYIIVFIFGKYFSKELLIVILFELMFIIDDIVLVR